LKTLITGGTGFIGQHLVGALRNLGVEVTLLSRGGPGGSAAENGSPAAEARLVTWNPEAEGPWFQAVEGQDVVFHLAGSQAVGVRWTEREKQRIRSSRVTTTRLLVNALERARTRPRVLVSASAVGYYGAQPADRTLTEEDPHGEGFLAEVCVEWEAAARAAEALGVRVVNARFGIVLGRDGGALREMVAPFRMFVGGPIGDGTQVVSWVHVTDAAAALIALGENSLVSGAANITAPEAVTQADLARAIGQQLGRPSWLPVPKAALALRFGEGAEPLVTGQRVRPRVLEEIGFRWQFPTLRAALAEALAGDKRQR
jgi:uncharacterized protein (TIGR01777 family)